MNASHQRAPYWVATQLPGTTSPVHSQCLAGNKRMPPGHREGAGCRAHPDGGVEREWVRAAGFSCTCACSCIIHLCKNYSAYCTIVMLFTFRCEQSVWGHTYLVGSTILVSITSLYYTSPLTSWKKPSVGNVLNTSRWMFSTLCSRLREAAESLLLRLSAVASLSRQRLKLISYRSAKKTARRRKSWFLKRHSITVICEVVAIFNPESYLINTQICLFMQ